MMSLQLRCKGTANFGIIFANDWEIIKFCLNLHRQLLPFFFMELRRLAKATKVEVFIEVFNLEYHENSM
jgi:hypothetical protein